MKTGKKYETMQSAKKNREKVRDDTQETNKKVKSRHYKIPIRDSENSLLSEIAL